MPVHWRRERRGGAGAADRNAGGKVQIGAGGIMRRSVMRKILSACSAICAVCAVLIVTVFAADAPKHRINRAIELLADKQPIYYTGSHEGTEGSFEQGAKDAQTWADYISYDMEHAPFDVKGLALYMQGLVKGGPTKSG